MSMRTPPDGTSRTSSLRCPAADWWRSSLDEETPAAVAQALTRRVARAAGGLRVAGAPADDSREEPRGGGTTCVDCPPAPTNRQVPVALRGYRASRSLEWRALPRLVPDERV